VRRALAVVILSLLPSTAFAQATLDAGSGDLTALQAEIERDYAQAVATASDCAVACRALESMKRAADRLCALEPGDRCTQAQQKLKDATDHVRSSCPACAQALAGGDQKAAPQNATQTPPPSPPPAAPGASPSSVEREEAVQKSGGCAGCATSSTPGGAVGPLLLGVVVLMAQRRRRRR
jgi:MYXO-CTERM domain-containing protein